nr:hypothetical protein [Fundidesulfovibrio agrisoli]
MLECTLRDGSYAVDFQFSPQDTALVARVLEEAGVGMVEIGHGLGLGASLAGKGRAAASDAAYMEAAAGALERARWGMFCIPGVARLTDLELAASLGMGFVRVGVNPSKSAGAAPFLARAAELKLTAFANVMKSYVLAPEELAAKARELAGYGASAIYVVDSAGCMLPEVVTEAVRAVAGETGLPVGFHGHDNLRLAVANSLAAWRAGAVWLDATLHGVGRGGGNAATEVLAAVLESAGAPTGLDRDALLDAGRALFGPLAEGAPGLRGLTLEAGRCGLHSSFLPLAEQAARECGVDVREVVRRASREEREEPGPELFRRHARELADAGGNGPNGGPRLPETLFGLPEDASETLETLGARVRSRARLTGRKAVMNVYRLPEGASGVAPSPFVQEGSGYVIGSLRCGEEALPEVAAALDGVVDVFFVDAGRGAGQARSLHEVLSRLVRYTPVSAYCDADVWARAVAAQVAWHRGGASSARIALLDASPLALGTALALAAQGAQVVADGEAAREASAALTRLCPAAPEVLSVADRLEAAARADVLLAFEPGRIDAAVVMAVPEGALVMDGGIGAATPEALDAAGKRGLTVLRPDMRAMLAAELRAALDAGRWLAGCGRGELAGQPVAAGGMVGDRGDIILDSLTHPTQVVGVADGQGKILDAHGEFAARLALVRAEVLRRRLRGGGANQ